MATHSSVLAWRIPGTVVPGGLPSMGSHRVGHDWSDLAAAALKIWFWWKSTSGFRTHCIAGLHWAAPLLHCCCLLCYCGYKPCAKHLTWKISSVPQPHQRVYIPLMSIWQIRKMKLGRIKPLVQGFITYKQQSWVSTQTRWAWNHLCAQSPHHMG